ncbi:hypothetical protein JK192_13705 [Gluconobacter cerinus]|uniref:hypothetical protein n=1 Tax=Gluconobacter cerinus TaxID=38307 RepID=UPI001B8BA045|nr:hypothetical protein [Gluconobacter cerinus]MBS1032433.1 hypothetical protein [Gluconobacter cerinus]
MNAHPLLNEGKVMFVEITDMNMSPEFRTGDYATIRKDNPQFIGDNSYLLEVMPGSWGVYRVQKRPAGFMVWQGSAETAHTVSTSDFQAINRGIVIGRYRVFDPDLHAGAPVKPAALVPLFSEIQK